MIGHLRGTLLESSYTLCTVEAAGVGYDVQIPLSTYDKLPRPGAEAELWVHTQVREDAITLFGFATAEERALFRILINVSGIGGKLALNVLSTMPVPNFRAAVVNGDLKALSRISGVGRRTAERMVVELRDKLPQFGSNDGGDGSPLPETGMSDAALALEQLGFKRDAIDKTLKELMIELPADKRDTENLLRQAIIRLNF